MKCKTILLFFLNFLSYGIYSQISPLADSIIYTNDNKVLVQIFNKPSHLKFDDYKEYRVYNSEGFYCLSLYHNDTDFIMHDKKNTLLLKTYADPDRDLIFISDSYDSTFIEILDKIEGNSFIEKYDSALRCFYHVPDYKSDSNIVKYLDSNADIQIAKQSKSDDSINDTINDNDEVQEVVFIFNTPNVPDLSFRYEPFARAVFTSGDLSKSEKRRNNNRLYFNIVADTREITELKCISDLRNKSMRQINEKLEILREMGLPVIPRGKILKLKAVFYIEFE